MQAVGEGQPVNWVHQTIAYLLFPAGAQLLVKPDRSSVRPHGASHEQGQGDDEGNTPERPDELHPPLLGRAALDEGIGLKDPGPSIVDLDAVEGAQRVASQGLRHHVIAAVV